MPETDLIASLFSQWLALQTGTCQLDLMKKTPFPATMPGRQLTAVIPRDGRWFTAFCSEIAGANGQGHSKSA